MFMGLLVVVLVLPLTAVAFATPASAAPRHGLPVMVPTGIRAGDVVRVGGRVRGRSRGRRVILQQRKGGRWISRSQRRLGKRRAFTLRWRTPRRGRAVRVRVTLKAGRRRLATSPRKRVLLLARRGKPGARVVARPSAVRAIPAPGSAGTVRYRGVLSIRRGDFLAAGVGAATPHGFLGRVKSARVVRGETRIATVPTTLLAAVPEGSIDVGVPAARSSEHSDRSTINPAIGKSLACAGGASIGVRGSMSVTPTTRFKASWSWRRRGVDSASFIGGVDARADITAEAKGSASCSLEKTPLLARPAVLGVINVQVGPIPVVLVPKLQVYLDAHAGVSADMTSGLHASLTANAGLEYRRNEGIHPISEFTPRFTYDPPGLTVGGQLKGNIRPTLDLLLYGVAGPRATFGAGLDLSASTAADPWWQLTAPVGLTAALVVPVLDLGTRELAVYNRVFDLAQAPGRFGAGAVTEFSEGMTMESLYGITRGPDNNLWYTTFGGIGRIDPSGAVTEFKTPGGGINAKITTGPDRNLWFTDAFRGRIGRITRVGEVTFFGEDSIGGQPEGITAGPDGNVWFTERSGDRIGRITRDGAVTMFAAGITPDSQPTGITAGPDGNLWFTEFRSSKIGRITPAGAVTEFAAGIGVPEGITAGPDGNLWFTGGGSIGRITTAGKVTEFPTPRYGGDDIAAGPDGALWFMQGGAGVVGRITTSGRASFFELPETGGFWGPGIAAGPDGAMWFTKSLDRKIGRITTGAG